MTLEESTSSSPSKYASSSLSRSRQLIWNLRERSQRVHGCTAISRSRGEKSPQHDADWHVDRLNTSWRKPFDVAQQLESIVPGDNQLRCFIPLEQTLD
jgi:hypothetical protein